MIDVSHTTVAKSTQQNADDYLSGPRTITVTKVELTESADQPVAIFFAGDDGKPYLPCKTCRRVLVRVWGPNASLWADRSMTIYRDDKVLFGGVAVGGIRISHMSHIDKDVTVAVNVTRGKKAPVTVRPLQAQRQSDRQRQDTQQTADDSFPGDRNGPSTRSPATGELTLAQRADAFRDRVRAAATTAKLRAIDGAAAALKADLERGDPDLLVDITELYQARFAIVEEAEMRA